MHAPAPSALAASPSTATLQNPAPGPSRSRKGQRIPNPVPQADTTSGISSTTFLLPPFSAPLYPAYHSPDPATLLGLTPGQTQPQSAPAPPPVPNPPQFRTSAATAQRKLVAAQRARLSSLSKSLTTRLSYASFKVENGWVGRSLSEVENLYYRSVVANRLKERQAAIAARVAAAYANASATVGNAAGSTLGGSVGGNAAKRTKVSGDAAGGPFMQPPPTATPGMTGKRKARDESESPRTTQSDAAGIATPISRLAPSPRFPPSTVGGGATSVQPSPYAWSTDSGAGPGSVPPSASGPSQTRQQQYPISTGSPPSKRIRLGSANALPLGSTASLSGAAALAAANAGQSSTGTGTGNASSSTFANFLGKSPASPLKLSNPSLGGGKQDIFTAHGLVTPPSFLMGALFPAEGQSHLQPQPQPQYGLQVPHHRPSLSAPSAARPGPPSSQGLLPAAIVSNGPAGSGGSLQPTPPLSEQTAPSPHIPSAAIGVGARQPNTSGSGIGAVPARAPGGGVDQRAAMVQNFPAPGSAQTQPSRMAPQQQQQQQHHAPPQKAYIGAPTSVIQAQHGSASTSASAGTFNGPQARLGTAEGGSGAAPLTSAQLAAMASARAVNGAR
ncbi:hypothetical protein V8E36_004173 [Tilletia maclaganii]